MEGCQHPHDDPFVIKSIVANQTIHGVLINNGSSTNIIFASAFDKMGIGREKLEPVNACLRGFSGERVLPLGSVHLVLTLGDLPCQATTTVRFLIVEAPSAYNMLLGRPSLNTIRVVPSAYHMVIKFPTANGVGMVRGNQRISRELLFNINEAKHGRQHLHGRARHARRGNHPTCAFRIIRAYAAWRPARTPRLHRI